MRANILPSCELSQNADIQGWDKVQEWCFVLCQHYFSSIMQRHHAFTSQSLALSGPELRSSNI